MSALHRKPCPVREQIHEWFIATCRYWTLQEFFKNFPRGEIDNYHIYILTYTTLIENYCIPEEGRQSYTGALFSQLRRWILAKQDSLLNYSAAITADVIEQSPSHISVGGLEDKYFDT